MEMVLHSLDALLVINDGSVKKFDGNAEVSSDFSYIFLKMTDALVQRRNISFQS